MLINSSPSAIVEAISAVAKGLCQGCGFCLSQKGGRGEDGDLWLCATKTPTCDMVISGSL